MFGSSARSANAELGKNKKSHGILCCIVASCASVDNMTSSGVKVEGVTEIDVQDDVPFVAPKSESSHARASESASPAQAVAVNNESNNVPGPLGPERNIGSCQANRDIGPSGARVKNTGPKVP